MFERILLSSDSCAGVGTLRPLLVATRQHRTRTPGTTALRPSHELSLSVWTRCRQRKLTSSGHNHLSKRLHSTVMRAAPNDPAPDTPTGEAAPTDKLLAGAPAEAFSPNLVGIAPSEKGQRDRRLERLRVSLLAALSSLDRGLAANAREAGEVDGLCSRLEALGGPVTLLPMGALSGGADEVSRDLLAGTWRLIYSSGFNSGSLGGRRPGPPAALFPTILGQVYQRIDPETAKLDNIVELLLNYGPPDWGLLGLGEEALGRGLTGLSKQLGMELKPEQLPVQLRDLLNQPAAEQQKQNRESPAARLTLRHDYEITLPATLRIVYEETYGELVGSDMFAQLPRLQAPSLPEPLRPPKFLRSATFDVTFLDETLRITRGDRGELRVYLRDAAADSAFGGTERNAGGAVALDYDD
ncbi:hypothetical protein VaNZ11_006334 [Volvox africanus]|uniref:Plastid lipid-associated protein/fibrillin conserved domain-containing protein n=1 Tax=Volvox africanus TaxID=51714 RepID=A0ABQ5S1S2_9CHLO|nr:hypothetical protein VaNZ11_006334 [Volvox africanus]